MHAHVSEVLEANGKRPLSGPPESLSADQRQIEVRRLEAVIATIDDPDFVKLLESARDDYLPVASAKDELQRAQTLRDQLFVRLNRAFGSPNRAEEGD